MEERVQRSVQFGLMLLAGLGILGQALAQQWPSRPVKIVVPFPPGNGTDILARLMAPKMTQALGQSVVVVNPVGAKGMIGAETLARCAPDGHSNHFTSPGPHVPSNFLLKTLAYH